MNSKRNLKGLNILEVGCKRGGGLNYLSKYLKIKKGVGIDFNY